MYNHYIKIDNNKNVIKVFSDAFEQPIEGDVLYLENTHERHFNMNLININNEYIYKWKNNKITEKLDKDYDLTIIKKRAKDKVKNKALNLIISQYPLYKQINTNELQGYDQNDKDDMWSIINNIRSQTDTAETEIDNLTTKSTVENYQDNIE